MLDITGILLRTVGNPNPKMNSCITVLLQAAADTLELVEMSNMWRSSVPSQRHHMNGNIKTSNRHGPLQCPNERLVLLDSIKIQLWGHVKFRVVVLVQRSQELLGRLPEHPFVVLEHSLHVGLR
jgi:hypothetical protein